MKILMKFLASKNLLLQNGRQISQQKSILAMAEAWKKLAYCIETELFVNFFFDLIQ